LDDLLGVSKATQLNTDDKRKLLVAARHNAAARDYLGMLERIWLGLEKSSKIHMG
jgi:hypothetical protein